MGSDEKGTKKSTKWGATKWVSTKLGRIPQYNVELNFIWHTTSIQIQRFFFK